jgi:N-acetylneuraminic acid mutarotase
LSTVEVFDPATNTWSTPAVTGGFAPLGGAASVVLDGKIYVAGGNDGFGITNRFNVLDPSTNEWSTPTTAGNFTPRNGPSACVVNGNMYVMGGSVGSAVFNWNEYFTKEDAAVAQSSAPHESLDVYPNPTSGKITVQPNSSSANFTVTICNLLGQRVMDVLPEHTSSFTLDLSLLPPGPYVMTVSGSGRSSAHMIVKE